MWSSGNLYNDSPNAFKSKEDYVDKLYTCKLDLVGKK